MVPNTTNMCSQCMSAKIDITEGITKQAILHFCKQCNRYLSPPWIKCELESQDLLSLCLKKIKGLNKAKLVDAGFVWTEPHSKRIKVRVTIQKEGVGSSLFQSTFIVEFVIENMQCDDCKKTWTPHIWTAAVQLRQKVDHKKTIMYLEQVILKHGMHGKAINVKEMPDGIDFYFATRTHALVLNDFIHSQVISRSRQGKQLVSMDEKNNEYNYKYTFSVEIAPVCREDLILLPNKLQKELGGASPIALCTRCTTMIQLLDIVNLRCYSIDESTYWSYEFKALCVKKQLSEFVIINIEPIQEDRSGVNASKIDKMADFTYADVELQRITDFAENDKKLFTRTHLGDILKEYDHVWGYDLETLNLPEIDHLKKSLPDVVIVKKCYRNKKAKRRIWKLKHLDKEKDEKMGQKKKQIENEEKEYEEFLDEIEENPEMRSKMNLYRDEEAIAELEKKMSKMELKDKVVKKPAEAKEELKEPAKPQKKGKVVRKERGAKKKEEKKAPPKPETKKAGEDDEWEDEDNDYPGVKLEELMAELKIEDKEEKESDTIEREKTKK